jgi:vacuolar-type H+-ATPase subunit I/STV1
MNLQFIEFLSIIFVSLILSVWLEVKVQNKTQNVLATMSIAFNINLFILGIASIWWILNASDNASVISGVQLLLAAFLGILLINIGVFFFVRNRVFS